MTLDDIQVGKDYPPHYKMTPPRSVKAYRVKSFDPNTSWPGGTVIYVNVRHDGSEGHRYRCNGEHFISKCS